MSVCNYNSHIIIILYKLAIISMPMMILVMKQRKIDNGFIKKTKLCELSTLQIEIHN